MAAARLSFAYFDKGIADCEIKFPANRHVISHIGEEIVGGSHNVVDCLTV